MECERALELISARIDREIRPEEDALLDAHLQACSACREALEAFAGQDRGLRAAFVPRRAAAARLAARVVERLPAASAALPATDPPRPPRIRWMLERALAAAAGFLIAALWFRPGIEPPAAPGPIVQAPPAAGAAELAFATGPVQVLPAGGAIWSDLAAGGAVERGARVRTGAESRCELLAEDGSVVRLNTGTELVLRGVRQYTLEGGQIFTSVRADPAPFQVQVPAAEAVVIATGTRFDVLSQGEDAVVTVLQGSTEVLGRAKSASVSLAAGEAVTVRGGLLDRKEAVLDAVVATRWVNLLLAGKGTEDPELGERINRLLAQIGRSKLDNLLEDEIRALGPSCARPLSSYILSELSRGDPRKRELAARIAADVAEGRSIPDFIEWLRDDSGEVRFHAARALERLTGRTMDRTPDDCRDLEPGAITALHRRWTAWWSENRDRFPGGSKSI